MDDRDSSTTTHLRRVGSRRWAERRGPERHARGLARVGYAVLDEIERVLTGYTERLRADPAVPGAREFSEAELEIFTGIFVADMAQCLTAIEFAGGAPSAEVRVGTAIQRLGWSAPEIRCELQIRCEELAAAVLRRVRRDVEVDADAALAPLARFIDHTAATSLRALVRGAGRGG